MIFLLHLNKNKKVLDTLISDSDRKKIVDSLGQAGSNYRDYNL